MKILRFLNKKTDKATKEKFKVLEVQEKAQKNESAKQERELRRQEKKLDELEYRKKGIDKIYRAQPAPKSSQQSIRYNRMYEDGVCEIVPGLYSKSFKISDINYEVARQEDQIEIFDKYCELLNYFDSQVFLQVSVINRKIDTEAFQNEMLYPQRNDIYDKYRKEYNSVLMQKAMEGQNGIVREKYITFSLFNEDYEQAVQELSRHETSLTSLFQTLGCDTQLLTGRERLEVLHSQLRPKEPFQFKYKDLIESSLTTKSFVCPDSIDFKPESTAYPSKCYYEFGEWYGQTIFLRDYPAELTDQLITDISRLPIDLNVTLHISAMEQDVAVAYVRKKLAFMEQQKIDEQKKALKGGYDMDLISTELKYSLKEAEELLDNLLNNNQRLFEVTVLVNTYAADKNTLRRNIKSIMSAARKKGGCKFAHLDFMQEEGLNSSLPLGWNSVNIQRTLTTACTAIFVPFTTQEVYQEGGGYYGLNALSKNLIFFNRRSLDSPNGLILGTPGSGKGMSSKLEIENVLLGSNDEIIVIDPENEYSVFAQSHGGQVINISAGSKDHLNPLDINLDYSDDQEPLALKSEFVLTICELLIGGKMGLSAIERSIIDRSALITYERYFSKLGKAKMPTMKDFHNVLKSQPNPEAQNLATSLEMYIDGSLSVFSHETNVNTQNRFVVYNVKDLGKQLRTFGMMVVLDQVWNRITSNRDKGIRTWFYTDEFQLITANEYAATYYFELWSRSRKWGAIPTAITQNVETMLLSDTARRMLSNSDFIIMTKQSTNDRDELQRLKNISPEQMRKVTNSRPGSGLLLAGKAIVPFVNEFPKDTELYKVITTKPDEVQRKSKNAS